MDTIFDDLVSTCFHINRLTVLFCKTLDTKFGVSVSKCFHVNQLTGFLLDPVGSQGKYTYAAWVWVGGEGLVGTASVAGPGHRPMQAMRSCMSACICICKEAST